MSGLSWKNINQAFRKAIAMRAMLLNSIQRPLEWVELPTPIPKTGQVLLKVHACGVCRTDLHIVDGELGEPKLPLILGHQIVGRVAALGEGVESFAIGQRVGVLTLNIEPWPRRPVPSSP